MKKISAAFLCLFLCLSLFAQSQPVKLSGGKMRLAEVFSAIERQTGLSVDYDASSVDGSVLVAVPSGTATVKNLLDSILPSRLHLLIQQVPCHHPAPAGAPAGSAEGPCGGQRR